MKQVLILLVLTGAIFAQKQNFSDLASAKAYLLTKPGVKAVSDAILQFPEEVNDTKAPSIRYLFNLVQVTDSTVNRFTVKAQKLKSDNSVFLESLLGKKSFQQRITEKDGITVAGNKLIGFTITAISEDTQFAIIQAAWLNISAGTVAIKSQVVWDEDGTLQLKDITQ